MSDEPVPAEEVESTSETDEPNIKTTVEDVSDEESVVSSDEEVAKPEVAEEPEVTEEPAVAEEEVTEEPEVVEEPAEEPAVAEEPVEVKSSDNDLEDRVKELEERLDIIINELNNKFSSKQLKLI